MGKPRERLGVELIPEELAKRIREFLESARTGKIALHIKEGRVNAWEITEQGRVAQELDKTLPREVRS
jgi:hypothetical protein